MKWSVSALMMGACFVAEAAPSEQWAAAERMLARNEAFTEQADLTYGHAGGVDLKGDLFLPEDRSEPRPGMLVIHGGGWVNGDKVGQAHFRQMARDYARIGFVVFNVNYRLAGIAKAPAAVEDVKCAVRFMHAHAKEWGMDPERIVVTGGSAGSHLALMVGLCDDPVFSGKGGWEDYPETVAAVINRFGITDVADVTYGKNPRGWAKAWLPLNTPGGEELARRLSPVSYAGREKLPPVLTIHGAEDPIVPVEHAMRLHLALLDHGHQSELFVVPFMGHGGGITRYEQISDDVAHERDCRRIDFLIRSGILSEGKK